MLTFVLFQLGWFACVLGGAHARPHLGAGIAAVVVGIQLARSARRRDEMALVAMGALFGVLSDSAWVALDLVRYMSGTVVDGAAPLWIVMMWALFATTITGTFSWLEGRPAVAALVGAAAGPLAYQGGASLGAATLVEPTWRALVAFALTWAVAMPLFVIVAARLRARAARP